MLKNVTNTTQVNLKVTRAVDVIEEVAKNGDWRLIVWGKRKRGGIKVDTLLWRNSEEYTLYGKKRETLSETRN